MQETWKEKMGCGDQTMLWRDLPEPELDCEVDLDFTCALGSSSQTRNNIRPKMFQITSSFISSTSRFHFIKSYNSWLKVITKYKPTKIETIMYADDQKSQR